MSIGSGWALMWPSAAPMQNAYRSRVRKPFAPSLNSRSAFGSFVRTAATTRLSIQSASSAVPLLAAA